MQELDFSKIAVPLVLTPQWILSKIDSLTIMLFYAGSFKIGKAFKSPLGGDSNPSARVIITPDGNALFQDFRYAGYLNCWQLVKKLHQCNFNKALHIVAKDFGLISGISAIPKSFYSELVDLDKEIKKECRIQFESEPWRKTNLKFWQRGDVTQKELEKAGDVFAISRLYVNNQEIANPQKFWRYAYVVECQINGKWEQRVKIYSPQDSKMKFLSSVPLVQPGNMNTLPVQDDRLFIIKSKKDWLTLGRYFTDRIWLQNESETSLPEEIIKHLKTQYHRIILCLGSDPHAVSVSQALTKKYELEYFNTAKTDYENFKCEDPFDISSIFGRKELEKQLKQKKLI